MNEIVSLYSKGQSGGELPYFIGKQYGSGWFRNIARLAFPILKKFGRAAVNTAQDALMNNKSILPSLKRHAMDAVTESAPAVLSMLNNASNPAEPPAKKKKSINKRKKQTIFKK